jgi:hypothetical protein
MSKLERYSRESWASPPPFTRPHRNGMAVRTSTKGRGLWIGHLRGADSAVGGRPARPRLKRRPNACGVGFEPAASVFDARLTLPALACQSSRYRRIR